MPLPVIPLIIDADPGIDDLLAILAALGCAQLNVLAVGVTHGNVPVQMGYANTRRILALAGRSDIPVGLGAARPLVELSSEAIHDIHGEDGLGNAGDRLPKVSDDEPTGAVELYRRILSSHDHVTLAAIGPLTNIAALLAAHPELSSRIERIVVMGGGDNRGNTTSVAEFNVLSDPHAAERVFSDHVPITMVGVELTRQIRFGRDWLARLQAGGHVAQVAAATAEFYLNFHEGRGRIGMPVHDAQALAAIAMPDAAATNPVSVAIECGSGPARGATVVRHNGYAADRAPVDQVVAMDADRVGNWCAEGILALDSAPGTEQQG